MRINFVGVACWPGQHESGTNWGEGGGLSRRAGPMLDDVLFQFGDIQLGLMIRNSRFMEIFHTEQYLCWTQSPIIFFDIVSILGKCALFFFDWRKPVGVLCTVD